MEILKTHQLDIMMFMSGICCVLVILTLLTRTLSPRRRHFLACLEAGAMFLLLFDRCAYFYRGAPGALGFWMVRISNFMVFFLTLYELHCISMYLLDMLRSKGILDAMPRRLFVCEALFFVGVIMLVISQFTGLYYTFGEGNTYQRSPGFVLCYIIPILIMLLQNTLVVQYRRELGRRVAVPLILFSIVPIVASILQIFSYGLSLVNMSMVGMSIVLYLFVLVDMDETLMKAQRHEIELYKLEKEKEHDMFEQTAEALVSAIDAKDKYTHGHSSRVAEYSQRIAREAGKTEEECEQVYFAALLHDVGKIGIRDSIINKDGRLTDEEFAEIKMHPVYGNQILSRIQQLPYLSIGAHYHHERFDGRGYPERLKGEDIPEIARIIAVADAYDAMTSKRSYRDPIPQMQVREELVKGMGTQFDPQFAKIMMHLLDLDTEYHMQEREECDDATFKSNLDCVSIGNECSTGIHIIDQTVRLHLYSKPMNGFGRDSLPTLVLFDSLDGRVHNTEAKRKDLMYLEYGQVRLDGRTLRGAARKMVSETFPRRELPLENGRMYVNTNMVRYDVEAVRCRDHLMLKISDSEKMCQIIMALPDSTHFTYLAITGEHCLIRGIRFAMDETKTDPDTIPRIAEEVSFIRGCPEGDIPNVQIDGWRTASSAGVPILEEMKLRFHAFSLPFARLVWHCPYVCVYTSQDGSVGGEDFREFVLVRLDGENWESDALAENNMIINRSSEFPGWNEWKATFKQGVDCEVSIRREGREITVITENLGVSIRSVTHIHDEVEKVYVALTGDECAITDIRVENGGQTDPPMLRKANPEAPEGPAQESAYPEPAPEGSAHPLCEAGQPSGEEASAHAEDAGAACR